MEAFKSKIIVRKFPPSYTEIQFDELVKPWIEEVNFIRFAQGKKPKPLSTKPMVCGRGYLNFLKPETLLEASKKLHGLRVTDDDGYEGILEVSLALSQSIPAEPIPDPLDGTYEESALYKEFLATLEAEKPAPLPIDKQVEYMLEKEKELHPWKYNRELMKETPLLIHLRGLQLSEHRKNKSTSKSKKSEPKQPKAEGVSERAGNSKPKKQAPKKDKKPSNSDKSAVPTERPKITIMSRASSTTATSTHSQTSKPTPPSSHSNSRNKSTSSASTSQNTQTKPKSQTQPTQTQQQSQPSSQKPVHYSSASKRMQQ